MIVDITVTTEKKFKLNMGDFLNGLPSEQKKGMLECVGDLLNNVPIKNMKHGSIGDTFDLLSFELVKIETSIDEL